MHVLVADDDRLAREFLGTLCRNQGWEVRYAVDAMQAVMLAGRDPRPDVILLDLRMPAGTGTQALERIKSSARTAGIPVIVVSGAVEDPATVARLQDLGAAGVLPKPPDPAQLVALVESAVAR